MNKQRNQIVFFGLIIAIGLLYIYVQYLFLPQLAVLKEMTAFVASRQDFLAEVEESSKNLPALKEQVSDLESEAGVLNKKVPKDADMPDMTLTIYNLAKNTGLTPVNLNFDSIKDHGGYLTIGMTFSCTGEANNIYSLVEKFLKGNKYIFALESISVIPQNSVMSANMKLIAYIYKE